MPSLSRRLLGPHAVCLATEGGIFHFVPSPERAAFFFSCFIDTGGSGSCSACDSVFIEKILMHLWEDVNLHSRWVCFLVQCFTAEWLQQVQVVLFRPRWCSADLAACILICVTASRFWHKRVVLQRHRDNAAVKSTKAKVFFLWRQNVSWYHAGINASHA